MSDFNEYVIQIDRRREVHTQFFITYEHLEHLISKYGLKVTDEERTGWRWEERLVDKLVWKCKRIPGFWDDLEGFSEPRTQRDTSDVQSSKISKYSAKKKLGI